MVTLTIIMALGFLWFAGVAFYHFRGNLSKRYALERLNKKHKSVCDERDGLKNEVSRLQNAVISKSATSVNGGCCVSEEYNCFRVANTNTDDDVYILIKSFYFKDGDEDDRIYAKNCAEELCDMLNENN